MIDPNLEAQTRAATVYEEFFVPALFAQWTELLLKAAAVGSGGRVLDVGCGTGVLARDAARRVGASGFVAGIDPNPGMLAVALRVAPELEWREGVAESLPYDDGMFDAVLSQFGLMFFSDRTAALHEMMRVLAPGGRLALAVWDALDNIPAYSILVALIQHLVGKRAADALRQPFILGDPAGLRALFERAGIDQPVVETHTGVARYPSIRSWVLTDVKGWFPLVDVVLDKAEYDTLAIEAERALALFAAPNQTVEFPISVHVVSAAR
ncbi:MAG TPA: methyltransferase domain-containing protein [Candidatus Krumholzibacteria bacterium]|nr:methyltransferase domain-containing protein [Candidatus Krumholzibacteria bacterium]